MSPTPRFKTQPGNGGNWHIYPGGRRVFVRKQPQAGGSFKPGGLGPGAGPRAGSFGGGAVGPAAGGIATRLPPRRGGASGGAGGAPAAPGAASTRPVDPAFTADSAAISKAYEQQVAGVTQQRQAGVAEYGLGEDLKFDPNNPLSKAALLKKNYDATRKVTGLGMGAGGGLYSGAYQSAQNAINRGQVGAEDQLQKNFTEFLRQNSADYATAGTDYDANMARAESDRMGRIPENPLYEPTSNLAPGATGKPKKPKKKKGRR